MSTQQEKLRQLAEITAKNKAEIERTVYYDDFVKAFQSLMEFVDKAKNSLEETANNRSRQIDAELDKALKEINTKAETLSNLHQKAANDLKSDQRTFQRYIDEKLREVNDNLPDDYDDQELVSSAQISTSSMRGGNTNLRADRPAKILQLWND